MRNETPTVGHGTRLGVVRLLLAVFCCVMTACGESQSGRVWGWGNNYWYQLGVGLGLVYRLPAQAAELQDVVAVRVGDSHSLALRRDGTVWAWGANDCGQLGDGTTFGFRLVPGPVPGMANVVSVDRGFSFSMLCGATVPYGRGVSTATLNSETGRPIFA
ncbi:MAG: hypothetical protein KIS66_11215 [Fimbriimonadaceae bacterium]|nr:hypothetical protein [Fimbriimonadaceae bacterium]